jgi:hypothetical protein
MPFSILYSSDFLLVIQCLAIVLWNRTIPKLIWVQMHHRILLFLIVVGGRFLGYSGYKLQFKTLSAFADERRKLRFLQVFSEFGSEDESKQQGYRKDKSGIHLDGSPTGVVGVDIGRGIGSV